MTVELPVEKFYQGFLHHYPSILYRKGHFSVVIFRNPAGFATYNDSGADFPEVLARFFTPLSFSSV